MILKCACGRVKRGPQQPFRATGVVLWVCPDCRSGTVRALRVLRKTIPSIKVIHFESKRSVIGMAGGKYVGRLVDSAKLSLELMDTKHSNAA